MKNIALLAVVVLAPSLAAQVLAQVDDAVLTWEDLLEQAGGIEALSYMGITSESEASQILESWVRERLVVAAAESAGFRSRPDVEKAVRAAIDQVLIEVFISDVLQDVQVSRLDVDNYLDIWSDSYGKEYNARHILLDSGVLAGSVLSRLSGGESFESLAVNFSSCPSSRQGGNLGWLRRGMTSATFMEAVCSLEPGQVSGIVETTAGFHIIQLLEVRDLATLATRTELVQLAGEELLATRQEKAVMDILADLRGGHSVTVYPQRLLEKL
ncbi:MAG: peptidylprolyl isomerase [Candidatus Fermentibacteraceae bacterium]